MNTNILFEIRKNPLFHEYLKYHSYWYKELYRNPSILGVIEEEMKKEYKLTLEDKINTFNDRLSLISTFLEVMQ